MFEDVRTRLHVCACPPGRHHPVATQGRFRGHEALAFLKARRSLEDEVTAGRFRMDLYYRLNVVDVHLPPLRERADDIPLLVDTFIRDCARRFDKPLTGASASALRLLGAAPWPGNIRELRNVVERACLLADGTAVGDREVRDALTPGGRRPLPDRLAEGRYPEPLDAPCGDSRPDTLAAAEQQHLDRVLAQVGGDKSAAAARLGINRRSLYRRLARLRPKAQGAAGVPTLDRA
ncbi:MAG: sigma-54-dependent Fis family transcriptional regulator [Acidimicrobiia bacterium]|nr:sigma-54-dependent Fis family transcriptional regulator [Acidimicrobiia bacterium]